MISALLGRLLLILAFIGALVSPTIPVWGYTVAGLVLVGGLLCCSSQKHIWHDGWHAAHDHHQIPGSKGHLKEFEEFLARQTS